LPCFLDVVAAFDIDATEPDWSLAFRFDLVLRGQNGTPFGI
jgi:protocatechuate 3,4-dioxygenase beta subunit